MPCACSAVTGFALPVVLVLLGALLLLGSALAVLGTNDLSLAGHERDSARAYYTAEAGAVKGYYYLTRVAPDGSADGSWRTAELTEPLATGEQYTIAVADGTGPFAGSILITSTGQANRARRAVRLVVSPSGLLPVDKAIVTQGPVGTQGVVQGDVAAASVDRGTQVSGQILGPQPLPQVNLDALRKLARAQGTYFRGASSGRVDDGRVTLTDSTGYRRPLPTTFTTSGDDRTGAVHVIFIDDSAPGAGDGTVRLDGRYTIGGLIVAMGATSAVQPDDSFGGNFTIDGIFYTPGDVRLNGGGSAQNLTGAILAGQGITLNGSHVTVIFSPQRVARAAAASMTIGSSSAVR